MPDILAPPALAPSPPEDIRLGGSVAASLAPGFIIRPAAPEDVDRLVDLENAAFPTDRLSRRSFRRLVASPTARLIVAEETVPGDAVRRIFGYALVLFRAGTALARLYSIAVADVARSRGVGRALLDTSEREAYEHDCIVLRLEVRADNATALTLYKRAGYRQFGRYHGYYGDHMDALRLEKRLAPVRGEPHAPVPFYEQTTDFTCGPACIVMSLLWAGQNIVPSPRLELKLWREATTIFMSAGHGGCEPYGLAVTLARRGLAPEIHVSRPGPYFLEGVRSAEKRLVMTATQEGFEEDAAMLGVPTRFSPLSLADLLQALDEGALALVLVSGYRMFAKKVPHWVLVVGHDGRHIFVNDPWVEDEHYETSAAAANLPIPFAEFQRMAKYGQDTLKASILVRKDIAS